MTTIKQGLLTADDLLEMYSQGIKGELIRGVLHETVATGGLHGDIAFALGSEIRAYVRPRRMGRVGGTDSGILLERNPDTVREPDIYYISAAKLPLDLQVSGYFDVVPDMVAEIFSPSDRPRDFDAKIQMWLDFGVRMVLAIYPQSRTITARQPSRPPVTLGYNDTLDGGDVIPGFQCPMRDIFDL